MIQYSESVVITKISFACWQAEEPQQPHVSPEVFGRLQALRDFYTAPIDEGAAHLLHLKMKEQLQYTYSDGVVLDADSDNQSQTSDLP